MMQDTTAEHSASGNSAASEIPIFALPSTITIQTTESIHSDLKNQPINTCDVFMLDACLVEIITTPGIQLVISIAKSVESHGGIFLITKPAAAFKQAFSDAGLNGWLSQREASHG